MTFQTPLRAILLDFDGTLVDSEPLHYEAWSAAVAPHGAKVTWEDYQERFVGKTDVWAGEVLLSEAGVEATKDLIDEVRHQKHHYFRERSPERLAIPEASLMAIAEVPADVRIAVVSSSKAIDVEPTIRKANLESRVSARVYGDHVQHHKPDPEPYNLALSKLALPAEACVAFEDSKSGLASAKAANILVRHVTAPTELPRLLREVLAAAKAA